MVRMLAASLMVSISAVAISAPASNPSTGKTWLPAIADVTIKENAARSPAAEDSAESCTKFVLTKRDVLEFMARSAEVSEHDYFHMLDWSPCYASGELVFKDGQRATWGIHRYRGGSIKFRDSTIRYLTCPKCRAKAFLSTR